MKNNVIIADAGNTVLKLALFVDNEPKTVHRINYQDLNKWFNAHKDLAILSCVLSSVTHPKIEEQLRKFFKKLLIINHNSNFPIKNNYQTPTTLGIDRVCNAVAISILAKGKNSASIDIGTCVKYDFVDKNGNYLGGSISPGINLRYKSLNDYTVNLPLLKPILKTDLIGTSTNGSIHSGVINGIQAEIDGIIRRYEIELGDLTFFVTGGDSGYFDFEGKNNIFADENLTLKGLYYIHEANVY
jgi:type III pantothenate kinase